MVQKRNAIKQNRVIKGNKVFKNANRANRPLIVFRSFVTDAKVTERQNFPLQDCPKGV